jgi:hypothetical protein
LRSYRTFVRSRTQNQIRSLIRRCSILRVSFLYGDEIPTDNTNRTLPEELSRHEVARSLIDMLMSGLDCQPLTSQLVSMGGMNMADDRDKQQGQQTGGKEGGQQGGQQAPGRNPQDDKSSQGGQQGGHGGQQGGQGQKGDQGGQEQTRR